MINALCRKICFIGKFSSIKVSQILLNFVYSNMSLPFIRIFIKRNTKIRIFSSRFSLILQVFRSSNSSQVNNPIVSLKSVNMIYCPFWKCFMKKHPSKSMCKKLFPFNSYMYISSIMRSSSNSSSRNFAIYSNFPSKVSCKWTVIQDLLDVVKINVAHAVASLMQWLRSYGSVLTHRAVAPL